MLEVSGVIANSRYDGAERVPKKGIGAKRGLRGAQGDITRQLLQPEQLYIRRFFVHILCHEPRR